MKELTFNTDTIRVFFHVLGVTVWIGGQIVVGALVPALRKSGEGATQKMAQRFNKVAWPAFAVIVFTGIWGLGENFDDYSTSGKLGLFLKLGLVSLSGMMAWMHTHAEKPSRKGMFAAGALLTALAAMLFGLALSVSG